MIYTGDTYISDTEAAAVWRLVHDIYMVVWAVLPALQAIHI